MAEETKSNSVETKYYADYLTYIIDVVKKNEEFLRKNAKDTYEEIVALMNDAIDNIGIGVNGKEGIKDYVERSMAFFVLHILMPFSYAIYMDLLAGNVPACFMELRLMVESLAKCYVADASYPELTFFQERIDLLDRDNPRISKLMKELGRKPGMKDFFALWRKLSQNWVHTKGIVNKIVDYVNERPDVPAWALIIPMQYTVNDLATIDELRRQISQFRSLLTTTMERYRQEHGLCK